MQPPLPTTDCLRWHAGHRGGHVESFFLKANNPQRPEMAFWLKFTILDSGREGGAVAEVWAVRFPARGGPHVGAKSTLSAADCHLANDKLELRMGECLLRAGKTSGAVGEGAEQIRWDLEFDYADQQPMYGLPHRWMYEAAFPRNKVYTSCPSTRFRGTVSVGDEAWQISDWPGMLGHNWGASHNPRYHWAQCNLFEGEDCVFEGYSARLKLGPWLSPWLTGAMVRFEGEDIAFNAVSRALNKTVQAELFRWSFDARQGDWQIRWHVEADREDFAGLDYVNPDGGSNFCLNSKIATCNLQLSRREGGNWQQVADLWGRSSCAYEILVQDLDHGVPILA